MKYKNMGVKENLNRSYCVVLDTGDEIISSLKNLAEREGIKGASISGIGTLKDPELGFFDLGKREYLKKTFKGDFELLSLLGNISVSKDGIVVHNHVLISDDKFATLGGHLFKGTITGTGEIMVETLGERVERRFNEKLNLNLIEL